MLQPTRTIKYYLLKLKRLNGDPQVLARGVALGTFIGITPTIPLHTALILVLSFPFRASKISSLTTSFLVSNPLTIPVEYYLAWFIGNQIIPGNLSRDKLESLMHLVTSDAGFMVTLAELGKLSFASLGELVLGGIILALPFTIIAYFVSLKIFKRIEKRRLERLARKGSRE